MDTGGTFTDLVAFDGGRFHVHKVLSTPDDPARAVLTGLRELIAAGWGHDPARVAVDVTYGSTVATNAVLERKGARVLLLTTVGFEDLIEIGRQTRLELYALEPRKPEPLIPRHRRVGVVERMTFEGTPLVALSAAALRRAVQTVRGRRAESVAVCLLHAYANPVHERRLGRAVRALGVPCSLSYELVAEYREYERLSTTVINAYVAPVMSRHLQALAAGLGATALRVMQSNGGAIAATTACREPVRTLLSGPAAGVVGAAIAARRLGLRRIISFDMGGTSTDVSLVDGEARQHTEWRIGALPVKVPAIDIHTVGAGGGSLAACDAGGVLKVGPDSAGADPGPACYGRGERPTVTDADLVLGRLVPDAFLGGRMRLDVARARRALALLARRLGLSVMTAAEGVVRVVNAAMERAIRRISVERGHDPRDYTLVAFGGAAGMHACELAAALGIPQVLVPWHPGLLSAWGALAAEVQRDYVQTIRLLDPDPAILARRLRALAAQGRRALRADARGVGTVRTAAFLDVRYRGQSYELRIPMSRHYRRAFHTAHRRLYGYADERRPVEVVNLRVSAIETAPALPRGRVAREPAAPRPHALYWCGRWRRARVLARAALPAGRRVPGPLVVVEFSATTIVPPGWTVRALPGGELMLNEQC